MSRLPAHTPAATNATTARTGIHHVTAITNAAPNAATHSNAYRYRTPGIVGA